MGARTSAGRGAVPLLIAAAVGVGAYGGPSAPASAGGEATGPVHRTCPKVARHTAKSHEADADRIMLPAGARSVLLCRYHGLNPARTYQRLDASRLVGRSATVTALERGVNASMPFQEGVVLLCPRDVGEKAVAFFRYGKEHEVAILIRPGGCATVSNGRLAWQADWKAISLLLRLTR